MTEELDPATPPSRTSRGTKFILGVSAFLAALVGAIKYAEALWDMTPWRSVAKVEITTESTTLPAEVEVGSFLLLKARLKDARDHDLPPRNNVDWGSNPEEVAKVSTDGKVTGLKKGDAMVTATCPKAQAGRIKVHVGHVAVQEVVVFPPHKNLPVSATLSLEATPRDAKGNRLDESEPPVWSSDSDAVATVSRNEREAIVTAVGPGSATISAKIDAAVGWAKIDVPATAPQPAASAPAGGAPSPVDPAAPPQPAAIVPAGEAPSPAVGARSSKPREALSPRATAMAEVQPRLGVHPNVAVMASVSTSMAVKIVLVNDPKMADCKGLRILLDETLVELESGSLTVYLPQAGTTNYTVGGTVLCPGGTLIHGSGEGSINVTPDKRFTVRFKLLRPTDAVVQLVEE